MTVRTDSARRGRARAVVANPGTQQRRSADKSRTRRARCRLSDLSAVTAPISSSPDLESAVAGQTVMTRLGHAIIEAEP
jgi:hypothetical protein